MRRSQLFVFLAVLLVLAVGASSGVFADKGGKKPPKPPKPELCENWDLACLDVWNPVVCDDGKTYSNQCYADRVCATGCIPADGGPMQLTKGGKKPPKPPISSKCPNGDMACLDVWDPVVCDDGKTYSNQCYADRVCATGCVPAGEGPMEF